VEKERGEESKVAGRSGCRVESLIGVGVGVGGVAEGELGKSVTDWASASAMLILAVGRGGRCVEVLSAVQPLQRRV
jgi:hypothetical protein